MCRVKCKQDTCFVFIGLLPKSKDRVGKESARNWDRSHRHMQHRGTNPHPSKTNNAHTQSAIPLYYYDLFMSEFPNKGRNAEGYKGTVVLEAHSQARGQKMLSARPPR